MASTLEQLNRKIDRDTLERASVHDRLRGLSAEEILDVFRTRSL